MSFTIDTVGACNDTAAYSPYYYSQYPVSFRGSSQSSGQNSSIIIEDKKSGRAGLVLGGLVTAGIIALGVAGYIKGDKNAKVVQRTWDGVKTIFKSTKNKFVQEHPTVSKEGENVVMRFAGEKNHIHGDNALTELDKIGEKFESNKLSDILEETTGKLKPGNEMTGFKFTYTDPETGKALYQVTASGRNSKDTYRILQILPEGTTTDVTKTLDPKSDIFKNLQGRIESYRNCENLGNLDELFVRSTNTDTGLVKRVRYNIRENGGNISYDPNTELLESFEYDPLKTQSQLVSATSDKFALGSDKVDAYLADHESAQKVIDAVKDNKTKDLKAAFAERVVPEIGTFKLDKNGNIIEIIENGKTNPIKPGDDRFKALMHRAKGKEYSFDKISSDRTKWSKASYYA